MAVNYVWKITAMKKAPSLDGLSDVITGINFTYTGTDEDSGKSGVFNGACPVAAPDKDSFAALKDLKEADVIEWAKANHPVDHMQEVIAKDIANQITPKNEEAEMPWAPEEASDPVE